MRFIRLPVAVEAEQFFYDKPPVKGVFYPDLSEDGRTYIGDAFVITAHDQRVYLQNGDWILPEPDGEHFYPVKDEIFRATYEAMVNTEPLKVWRMVAVRQDRIIIELRMLAAELGRSNGELRQSVADQDAEIQRLRAENQRLTQIAQDLQMGRNAGLTPRGIVVQP